MAIIGQPIFDRVAKHVALINTDGSDYDLAGQIADAIGGTAPGVSTGVTRINSTVYEAKHVLKSGAGKLVQVRGYNKSGSDCWLMIFDASAVPANGATNWVNIQKIPGGGNFAGDMPFEPYANGISVAISTTDTQLTLAGADTWFTADVAA